MAEEQEPLWPPGLKIEVNRDCKLLKMIIEDYILNQQRDLIVLKVKVDDDGIVRELMGTDIYYVEVTVKMEPV